MPASQHQGHSGLRHPRHHLRDGQSRLDVAAHGVQQQQHAVHLLRLLQMSQQRQDMLIFRGFRVVGSHAVALHLADDGQAVHAAPLAFHQGSAQVIKTLGALVAGLLRQMIGFLRHGTHLLIGDSMCIPAEIIQF